MRLPTLLLILALGLTHLQSVSAAEAQALSPILARLDKTKVIQASFTQTKTLRALKRPLVTHGNIVFMRDKGVLWRIDKPYKAAYLLSPDSVTEVFADGRRRVRGINEVPALAQVGKVFQAIFQGDTQVLSNYFEITHHGDATRWRLELKPKPQLAQFLKSIQAQGGEFLDRLDISEANGDLTRIEFSNGRIDASLDAADIVLFSSN